MSLGFFSDVVSQHTLMGAPIDRFIPAGYGPMLIGVVSGLVIAGLGLFLRNRSQMAQIRRLEETLIRGEQNTYELESNNKLLRRRADASGTELDELKERMSLLQAVLDNISQGVTVYDKDLKLAAWSRGFVNILELPESWPRVGRHLSEFIRYNAERGEYGDVDVDEIVETKMAEIKTGEILPHRYERPRANGVQVEVAGNPMPNGGVVTTYSDITERKAAERQIQDLALRDPLTGLANRNLFLERLGETLHAAHKNGRRVGLLMLDLDKFKPINDTHGHPAGDELLKTIADRLKSCTRDNDTVARLGGDEFAVIYADLIEIETVNRLSRRILEAMAQPITLGENRVQVGGSIGISLYPDDDRNSDELMRKADLALYEAKSLGGGCFRHYEQEVDARARYLRNLEDDLRLAVARGEFALKYQPQFDITGERVVGAEAFLRWGHPARGELSPADFMHVAESSGLIVNIGEWVINEACRQAKDWRTRGYPEFRVAANISPTQFRSDSLFTIAQLALQRNDLEPRFLELEITERTAMDTSEDFVGALNRLKELGVTLSIDDFGTGLSSLSRLQSTPLDRLKIDQSFVQGVDQNDGDRSIAKAIIELAHSFDLGVVAEGVETVEQQNWLEAANCDEAQGFYFCEPKDEATFSEWLDQRFSARDREPLFKELEAKSA
jgi:diguanylate cyclase (GGDEF)-like protein